eukprot:1862636-Rhodomonas_salina.1
MQHGQPPPLSRCHVVGRAGLGGTASTRLRVPRAVYWWRRCGPNALGAVLASSLWATHTCRASVIAVRMPR